MSRDRSQITQNKKLSKINNKEMRKKWFYRD